jgi:hypothetical protein
MRTTATPNEPANAHASVLFMAFELRANTWKLGCSLGHEHKPRACTMAARDLKRLRDAVAHAQARFGLCPPAPVVRWYEAGRAGCWRHRFLQAQGLTNHGVDAASIEGNRRQRRAKSAAVDVRKWWSMLRRSQHGERHVWRVVTVPSVEAEEHRHLHRALETLKQERARTTNRLNGVLRSQGGRLTSGHQRPEPLHTLRLWAGSPVPSGLRRR